MVVKDQETKNEIAKIYRDTWARANRIVGHGPERTRDEEFTANKKVEFGAANYNSVEHLADHFEYAPVLIVPFMIQSGLRPGDDPDAEPVVRPFQGSPLMGGSIYQAVQNMQLAARAYGIGSTYTSVANTEEHEPRMKELLGLPVNTRTMCIIPLGYPLDVDELAEVGASPARARFFRPNRIPVDEVTHWDKFGEQRERE